MRFSAVTMDSSISGAAGIPSEAEDPKAGGMSGRGLSVRAMADPEQTSF